MALNEMICQCQQIDYITIRKAMINGVRTLDELVEATRAGTCCGMCKERIEEILASVCGCLDISLADVVSAVENGASTVLEVNEKTKAGTACGKCNALIENIIALKR